jgi:hypothetical protein
MYLVRDLRKEELLRLLLARYTLKEAAAYLRVTPWTVRKYCREKGFMETLREKDEKVWETVEAELTNSKVSIIQRAEEGAALALDEMISLCQSGKSEMIRHKSAQDLMDRDPRISRTKRLEGDGRSGPVLNALFLQQAVAAMNEEDSLKTQKPSATPKAELIEKEELSKTQESDSQMSLFPVGVQSEN